MAENQLFDFDLPDVKAKLVSADNVEVTKAVKRVLEFGKADANMFLLVENDIIQSLLELCPQHEMVEEIVSFLGRVSEQQEYRQTIIHANGGLLAFTSMIKRYDKNNPEVNGIVKIAVDAISCLSQEDDHVHRVVRLEGCIPFLVGMLTCGDLKLYQSASRALSNLASKSAEIKNQILTCNGLPTLILFLEAESEATYHEAVCVLGMLAHGSLDLSNQILLGGALQPVINLLSSTAIATKRGAAFLLSRFIDADAGCKAHIVRRGAIYPLVEMLWSTDEKTKELSSYILGLLASDEGTHNQAGIARADAIPILLDLLDSSNNTLQENAAIVLFGLALSGDIVADFIRAGGFEKLIGRDFDLERTQQIVSETINRLRDRLGDKRVLSRMLSLMRTSNVDFQQKIVLALACLCPAADKKKVLVSYNGIDLLLQHLTSIHSKMRQFGCAALCLVIEEATSTSLDSLSDHGINAENVQPKYHSSVKSGDVLVRSSCVLFLLQNCRELDSKAWYRSLMRKLVPEIREFVVKKL